MRRSRFALAVAAAALLLQPGAVGAQSQVTRVPPPTTSSSMPTAPRSRRRTRRSPPLRGRILKENTRRRRRDRPVDQHELPPWRDAAVGARRGAQERADRPPGPRSAPEPRRHREPHRRRASRGQAAARPDEAGKNAAPAPAAADPLAGLQWDMAMIHATTDGSYAKQLGSHGVRVGIIDTGVDALAPGHRAELRLGAVAELHDRHPGHRRTVRAPRAASIRPMRTTTATARTSSGTIGAALNGIGIAGVAPDVDIVNIRAGQDSGFFFLQPSVDALTYAGDNGIDVVNMSYFIDPVAVQLQGQPGRHGRAADGAADDHQGDEPCARLRPLARGHADRRRGQRGIRTSTIRRSTTPAPTTRPEPSTTGTWTSPA